MQTIIEDYGAAIVYMVIGVVILSGLGKVLVLISAF